MENLESQVVYPNGYKIKNCPACDVRYNGQPHEIRTTHHILPQRFFGRNNKGGTIELCQDCHTELERDFVPQRVCLTPSEYISILNSFLDYKALLAQQEKTYKLSHP